MQMYSRCTQRGIAALRVDDAASRVHPVDVARADSLHRAKTVAMNDLAFEQIGHGGKADMRVRAHIQALPRRHPDRPHVIEEDEGADVTPAHEGQHASHRKVADILQPRLY